MTTWTDTEILTLREMWNKGHTCSQIARALNKTGFRFSRNAIIGKVHRLGMSSRITPARPVKKKRHPVYDKRMRAALFPGGPKMTVAPLAMPPAFERADTAIPLASLTSASCRWPLGDPKEPGFGFCGCDRHEGSPYCAEHTKRAGSGVQLKRVGVPPEYNVRRVEKMAA